MAKDVKFDIVARDKTKRAFDSVTGGLGKVSKASIAVTAKIAKIGGAFALAAGGATAALTRASMKNIDALAKTADKIGINTEALAGLQHAAELTGVSTETMNMALQRMTRRVAEAAMGSGEAVKALDELGINAAELQKLPLDVQMGIIADSMGKVTNQSDRVRLAMKLFDSEGVALVNTLGQGSQGLQDMAREAQLLGLAINRIDAAQVEAANDAVTRAQGVFTGVANQIAVNLSPVVAELATNFYQTALDMNEAGNVGAKIAQTLVKAFGHVANAVQGLRIAVKGIQFVFAKMAEGATFAMSKLMWSIDMAIEKYNQLAGFLGLETISFKPGEELLSLSESFGNVADQIKQEMLDMANQTLPSEQIAAFYDQVQMKARETAEVVAANAPGKVLQTDVEAAAEAVQQTSTVTQNAILTQANTLINTTQGQMQALQGIFAEGSAGAKAFFVISQALAAGSAIVNGLMSAMSIRAAYAQLAALTANPGLVAVGEAHANVAMAMGFATAGMIAGQTLASFEGGGFTGYGARAGGMDGKGGMLAMVHPNETVVDHTKGQGMGQAPVNVSFNIQANDTRGFDRLLSERRGVIVSLINQALNERGRASLGRV